MENFKKAVKRQQIIWKNFVFNGNPDATTFTATTLVLENPAEIQWLLTGNNLTPSSCTINNTIILQDYQSTLLSVAQYPFSFILKNNLDEIDYTTYIIKLSPFARLQVLCKYYVNV